MPSSFPRFALWTLAFTAALYVATPVFARTCPVELDTAGELCEFLDTVSEIRVVREDGTTRIERIPLGDGRVGAIEFSDTLVEGGSLLYEIDEDGVHLTGVRDLELIVEVDDQRAAVVIDVLDPVRLETVRTDQGFGLRLTREPDSESMRWEIALSEPGQTFVIEAHDSGDLTVDAHASTNRVRLVLRSEGGYARMRYNDVELLARNGRPSFIDLRYEPGTSFRAAETFHQLLIRDGVDIAGFAHLNRHGNLTLESAIGPLEASVTFMLLDGTIPESASELRGIMLTGGARWESRGSLRHAGVGLGLVPISMWSIRAQGAFADDLLNGEAQHHEIPMTVLAQLYAGKTTSSFARRYHFATYLNLADESENAAVTFTEPSEGGLLGALTYRSGLSNYVAVLATSDHDTTARFELNYRF